MTTEQLPWMAAQPYRLFNRSEQYHYAGGNLSKQSHILGPWTLCVGPFRNCANGDRAVHRGEYHIPFPCRTRGYTCTVTFVSHFHWTAASTCSASCNEHAYGLNCTLWRVPRPEGISRYSSRNRQWWNATGCVLRNYLWTIFPATLNAGPLTWSQTRIGYCTLSGSRSKSTSSS